MRPSLLASTLNLQRSLGLTAHWTQKKGPWESGCPGQVARGIPNVAACPLSLHPWTNLQSEIKDIHKKGLGSNFLELAEVES